MYTVYHLHSDLSLLDSATGFADYIRHAAELGHKAVAFTEHGNIFQWVAKKQACDRAGLHYIHGVECYLTEALTMPDPKTGQDGKVRDNYHTILLARNMDGLREINELVSRSYQEDHFYYKPRITFDEFLALSDNVITTSACLASPLNRLPVTHPRYMELAKKYTYFEVQPHADAEQVAFNRQLAVLSEQLGTPLIAGTDTHSLNAYKAECRTIRQYSKHIVFANEDSFDLTWKTKDELVTMFREQGALPESLFLEAIENTNRMADSTEQIELDTSFKYPILYGKEDEAVLQKTIETNFSKKIVQGAITQEQIEPFRAAIAEECRVFHKIDMSGFILFMSELATWCKTHDIPLGFNRGSCGGSRVAYITDITDLNPETWHTVFSRFASEARREIGDIDIDVPPSDRDRVYDYIINRFGQEKTAFILAIGTVQEKGVIDDTVRALNLRWEQEHCTDEKPLREEITHLRGLCNSGRPVTQAMRQELEDHTAQLTAIKEHNAKTRAENPYTLALADTVKAAYGKNPQQAKADYPDIFYYFEGLLGTVVSQSIHPAGIVASPVTLSDNYGTFRSDGKQVLQIDMECIHDVSLVKYDILGLANIGIIRDTCRLLDKPYPRSHEIDWEDKTVWEDMLRSPVGIFEFEGDYAFSMLREYRPQSIAEMSLVTAAIRPSGASYRDDLIARKPHKNPSPRIDELLKNNNGYLVYQEDVIAFLQNICGLSGSEADEVRRAIARKQEDRLAKALPGILEGYCKNSDQPRAVAEEEARTFLQIIEDSSSYMFGMNHSIGYCMLGYLCAWLRCYHPAAFITAYLNNAKNEEDVRRGTELAGLYGISVTIPCFGISRSHYQCTEDERSIARGVSSVKFLNSRVADELYRLAHEEKPQTFMQVLLCLEQTSLNSRQRDILIRIDFFRAYGNVPTLLRILEVFTLFREGTARRVAKAKLPQELLPILVPFLSDATKSGKSSTFYTVTDMPKLLSSAEDHIQSLHLPDCTFAEKIRTQAELLGYIDLTTGRAEDRRKLIITELTPLKNKTTGKTWAYALSTRSVGSGKTARLTVQSGTFNKVPFDKNDIVYAQAVHKNRNGYWMLDTYRKITGGIA